MTNIPSTTLSKLLVDYLFSLIYLNALQSLFFWNKKIVVLEIINQLLT